jgi:hypothetical protein
MAGRVGGNRMSTEIRLNRAACVTDFERDTEYRGPGTFELDDDVAEEYLQQDMWEQADAFDAADFLDVDESELVDKMTYPTGVMLKKWDDKLAALFDAEANGKKRRRILDLIQDREVKAKRERGKAGQTDFNPAETQEIGKLDLLGSRRPEQFMTEDNFRDGEAPEWARESDAQSDADPLYDESDENNPYEVH